MPASHPYIPPAIFVNRHSSETQQVQIQHNPCPPEWNDLSTIPWWIWLGMFLCCVALGFTGRFK